MTFERKDLGNTPTVTPTSTTTRTSAASSPRSTSSTSSRYTEPGVFHDLQVFKESWNRTIGPMNAAIAFFVEAMMAEGMEMGVLLNALQETSWARRPSPQYFRAIVNRYRASGLHTMEQVLLDQQEHEKQREWWEDEKPYYAID